MAAKLTRLGFRQCMKDGSRLQGEHLGAQHCRRCHEQLFTHSSLVIITTNSCSSSAEVGGSVGREPVHMPLQIDTQARDGGSALRCNVECSHLEYCIADLYKAIMQQPCIACKHCLYTTTQSALHGLLEADTLIRQSSHHL